MHDARMSRWHNESLENELSKRETSQRTGAVDGNVDTITGTRMCRASRRYRLGRQCRPHASRTIAERDLGSVPILPVPARPAPTANSSILIGTNGLTSRPRYLCWLQSWLVSAKTPAFAASWRSRIDFRTGSRPCGRNAPPFDVLVDLLGRVPAPSAGYL
jgi:hypothetical protein